MRKTPAPPQDAALIVFDWDGTVVDSIASIAESIRLAAADLSLPVPTEQEARHVIGLGLGEALRLAVPTLPVNKTDQFINRYRYHYLNAGKVERPFEGVPAMLRALHDAGRQLAVATGKSRHGLERAFEETGLGSLFVASRCADEGHPKPHPWMLESLAEEIGIAEQAMVMIGDTSHDIGMAQGAGAASIGVAYGAHDLAELQRARPDWLVDTVGKLRGLLEQGPQQD